MKPLNKGLSLSETIIVFAIISFFIASFFNWILNYLIILNTAKERLVALSLAQEGLELAIALRNKQYETTPPPSDWLGVNPGDYCISLETSTGKIITSTPTDIDGCQVFNSQNLIFKRLITYSNDLGYYPHASSIMVTSKVSFLNQNVKLNTVLIHWRQQLLPP